jgi:HK97 family phage major capsid protein
MNRKSLITLLKANGYAEAVPTLETVKAHVAKLASEGVELHAADGTPINVDAVWAAKSVLTLADDADTALSEAGRKAIIAEAKGSTSPHGNGAVEDRTPQRFAIGNMQMKAYDRKVKDGRAVFAEGEQAAAFGAWGRLTIAGQNCYAQKAADLDICKKTLVGFNNQLGGALVPQEFAPQLIWLTEQYGASKQLANVVPMSSESKAYPRKTGIASMVPISENGTISVSDNNYGNVTLTAKKYGVLFKVTNELFTDSAVNVADDLARSIAEAEAIAIDQAYFLGDGSSTYANQVGLAGALPTAAYITAATWASITKDHFALLMGAVENVNAARLKFACTRQFFVQVMMRLDKATSQFKDITSGNLGGGTFMGYPVQFAQVMPITSASASRVCYFGDFTGGSMIGDRQDLTIATSEQFLFNTNSVAVRGVARFNVNIHGDGRGSTVGPIAALVTT